MSYKDFSWLDSVPYSFDFKEVGTLRVVIKDRDESCKEYTVQDNVDLIKESIASLPVHGDEYLKMNPVQITFVIGLKENNPIAKIVFYDNFLQGENTAFFSSEEVTHKVLELKKLLTESIREQLSIRAAPTAPLLIYFYYKNKTPSKRGLRVVTSEGDEAVYQWVILHRLEYVHDDLFDLEGWMRDVQVEHREPEKDEGDAGTASNHRQNLAHGDTPFAEEKRNNYCI